MIPLHVHSYYTLLKGTVSPEKLICKAIEYNLNAIAITDINSMQGVVQFVKHARKNKIKPDSTPKSAKIFENYADMKI